MKKIILFFATATTLFAGLASCETTKHSKAIDNSKTSAEQRSESDHILDNQIK